MTMFHIVHNHLHIVYYDDVTYSSVTCRLRVVSNELTRCYGGDVNGNRICVTVSAFGAGDVSQDVLPDNDTKAGRQQYLTMSSRCSKHVYYLRIKEKLYKEESLIPLRKDRILS